MIKVGILGACGRMGLEIVKMVHHDGDLELVRAFDRYNRGADIGILAGVGEVGVLVSELTGLDEIDLVIDFTNAEAFKAHALEILENKVSIVTGSTGFKEGELITYGEIAQEKGVTLFYAPNFAIGAVLMMKFAKEAARYIDDVEVIEFHHDNKLDAPSGTAKKTLEGIAEVRREKQQGNPNEHETIAAARGGDYQGMRVHSVRLPGFVASQAVIFGTLGQTLTIRHDSVSRESFLPGIAMACKQIANLESGLIVGLESILE